MKSRIFLLSLIVVTFTHSATAQRKLTEVDLRVNGVGSGSNYRVALKKLGKPIRATTEKYGSEVACSGSAETHTKLIYPGLELGLTQIKNGPASVVSIEISSGAWVASGIRLGSGQDSVLQLFGQPVSTHTKDSESTFFYVTVENMGGVNFHFISGRLVKIVMQETLC
jgi:hypothetical protein